MRYLILFILAGLTGCELLGNNNQPVTLSTDHVDFSNLAVGQQSRYVGFEGGSIYDHENATFQYRQDTLILEVLSTTGSGFIFLERISAGSTSLANWIDSLQYRVDIHDDSLTLSALSGDFIQSNLFLLPERALLLSSILGNQIQLKGVITSSSSQELYESGYVLNHSQLEQQFGRLNIVVDRRSTVVDGPGYTVVYGEKAGIVRAFSTSAWTGTAYGWDLLP